MAGQTNVVFVWAKFQKADRTRPSETEKGHEREREREMLNKLVLFKYDSIGTNYKLSIENAMEKWPFAF